MKYSTYLKINVTKITNFNCSLFKNIKIKTTFSITLKQILQGKSKKNLMILLSSYVLYSQYRVVSNVIYSFINNIGYFIIILLNFLTPHYLEQYYIK